MVNTDIDFETRLTNMFKQNRKIEMSLVFPSTLDLDTETRSNYGKDVSVCRQTD